MVAALLLLQNLSAGHGLVRPRLVAGGAVKGLIRFLGVTPEPAKEMVDAAASTLANLMLSGAAFARLEAAGGVALLVR